MTVADDDPYDLTRFVYAQIDRDAFAHACDEIRAGKKRGHWVWFVFPQLKALGRSETSQRFGISGIAEAAAYLAHPVLGPRLIAVTTLVLEGLETDPVALFGDVDALKVRSSLTLFSRIPQADPIFDSVLKRLYGGLADPLTCELLELELNP